MIRSWARRVAVLTGIVFLAFGPAAFAHEERAVGAVTMRVGWLNEPTYTGSVNAVFVAVAHKGGGAIADAKLQTTVLFGDKTSSTKGDALTLEPSDETPGDYTAAIVPTRPGTYTFHVTGTAAGAKIDQYFTSSETTFDDVKDATADEFPAKDPSAAQLGQRLNNAQTKANAGASRATIALIVGAAGIVVGLLALLRPRG
jgi:hypothetical protein